MRGRREQPHQKQVRGEIDHEDEEKESDREVRGSESVGTMEEGILDGEVEILIWCDESRGYQNGQEDSGLQFPSAAIVA